MMSKITFLLYNVLAYAKFSPGLKLLKLVFKLNRFIVVHP
jgi:hypothetical protein